MNILTMGTCRIASWDSSLFSEKQVSNPTENTFKPFTTYVSNSEDLKIYVNPTGYCTSPPEFVDLLKVLHGELAYVSKKELSMYKEIHKYLPSDVITHVPYDKVVLEVCSRRFLKAPTQLKTKYNWGGETIPYKVMYEDTKKEFSFKHVDSHFKSKILLEDLEIEKYLSEFLNIAKVSAQNVYILGNYVLPPTDSGEALTLPPSVITHRRNLNTTLRHLSETLGFHYLDFSEVLELDKDSSSLSDLFHLSNLGVRRLSHFIHNLLLE